jgi:hypothetical protein
MDSLIAQVELRAKDFICDRSMMDNGLLEVYSKRGYMIQNRSHSVIMVKPLKSEASFKETYGDRFCITGLDFF